tara:strand:- start:61 stop:348 length:288 start_codon:yes stop_codon:yes gene_type:complete
MIERIIMFATVLIISLLIYINIDSSNNYEQDSMLLSNQETRVHEYSLRNFKSGISIQDIGDMIVINQKPNSATVIIDKDDLEDIIVFLNNTNTSE